MIQRRSAVSNERTDDEAASDGGEPPAPGERPSWAGPRDEPVDQPLPPDLESVRTGLEPEPGTSTLSYTDDPDRQATFGMSPRTDEEQAAIDARTDAQGSGQSGAAPSGGTSPTPPPHPAQGMTQNDIDLVADLPVESNRLPMWLVIAGAATAVLVIIGLFLVLGGGGDDNNNATSGGSTGVSGQVAAPTNPPAATATPVAPAAFRASAEQVRNANLSTTDLAGIFGTCTFGLTTNGATDVEQAVGSSPAMMEAFRTAALVGTRSVAAVQAACRDLPYNSASVSGNARDVPAAQALFTAARTNYQALFPGFKPVEVQRGQLDDAYCQYGVFPANNIIAVACWLRKGSSVTGVFILLPPNSQQAAIDEAVRDMQAVVQRVDGVLR
jgi:hypothetical protein